MRNFLRKCLLGRMRKKYRYNIKMYLMEVVRLGDGWAN
jgi:hypothetical protein